MRTYVRYALALVVSIGWLTEVRGQELTTRDNEEVKLLARRKIELGLSDLLNVLSLTDLGEAERNTLITESFTPGINQLFADKDVVVEDDVNPNRAAAATVLDMPVEKYLANFDLLYAKSTQSTILFSDVSVSDLKKGTANLYVKVYYTALFKGKHTKIDKAYGPIRRVAEIRAEQTGSKWTVLITRLAFATSSDSANLTLNNVALKEVAPRRLATTDSLMVKNDSTQRLASQTPPIDPVVEREKTILTTYQKLLKDGDAALTSGDLETAQRLYEQAEHDKPFEDLTPKVKLFRVQKFLEERSRNSLSEQKKRLELSLRKRRYAEAVALMQRIADQKPDSTALDEQIKDLIAKTRRKAELDERFAAGQYRDLIKEYGRLIDAERKQNKTTVSKVNSSDWYLGRGKSYTKVKDYKEALRDLNESITLDFQNLEALESRADLYARINDFPKAAADLSVYLTVDPTNADILTRRATYRVRTNRTAEAFADYDEAIRISNQNPRYYLLRGMLHQQIGACDKAEADFTEGINRSRRQADLYFQRGTAYICLQQYVAAGADFTRALELGLNAADRRRIDSIATQFYRQSEQNVQLRKLPEALAQLTIALQVKPDYADAWLAAGKIYSLQLQNAQADSALTSAIRFDPTNADGFYQHGLTKLRQGMFQEAIVDFRQTTTLQPTFYEASLNEAKAHVQLHQYDKAQAILATLRGLRKQLEKRYPPTFFADTYFLSGRCAYELRNYENALDQFEDALALTKDWAAVYTERGRAYEALAKPDRARDDYTKAAQLEPTVAAHYLPIGLLLEKREKFDDALEEYNRSQQLDRDHTLTTQISLGKGRCLMAQGKYLDALAELTKVGQYDGTPCTDECFYLRSYAQVRTGQLPTNVRMTGVNSLPASAENAPKIRYVLACAHLQANDDNQALALLEKAMQMGISKEFLKKDKLLDFVRKDFRKTPAYSQLVSRYRQ
ncbi:hypothetical protein GCM10027341_34940 [Spirosoma knui]